MKRNLRISAFTLIELLIVVAIIAILAAIAVPNFLEAQTRSIVSRTKADMRSIAVGLEAYRVDNAKLPSEAANLGGGILRYVVFDMASDTERDMGLLGSLLTSPVAYLSSVPFDLFNSKALTFMYHNVPGGSEDVVVLQASVLFNPTGRPELGMSEDHYFLQSSGPDLRTYFGNMLVPIEDPIYDPTNGTVSEGDIFYLQMAGPESLRPK